VNISKLTRLIWEENQIYDEYAKRSTYSSPSKEDGRGASGAIRGVVIAQACRRARVSGIDAVWSGGNCNKL
jgi:hypothetical protein